jgi:hypothetical protein
MRVCGRPRRRSALEISVVDKVWAQVTFAAPQGQKIFRGGYAPTNPPISKPHSAVQAARGVAKRILQFCLRRRAADSTSAEGFGALRRHAGPIFGLFWAYFWVLKLLLAPERAAGGRWSAAGAAGAAK